MIINGIFPVPVVKFSLDRPLSSQETSFLMDFPQQRNQGNSASVDRYVLRHKKARTIKLFVEECLQKYVESIYAPEENFRLDITQSWLNYTQLNEFHHKHWHPNSMISGVFYVSADEATDKIYFYKNIGDSFKVFPAKFNLFNSDSWWFAVKTGDLILFPSSLEHMVETKVGTDVRVSLAFNTFPSGHLGKIEEACRTVIRGVE